MAVNAVMRIKGAKGEGKGKAMVEGKSVAGWVEIQGWDWEVEADTSWTRGGGASVGKPNPGKMSWEHYFDSSSPTILTFIWSGRSFEEIELVMFKGTGAGQEWFFKMEMKDSFITKVQQSATEEGNVVQKVEMVFKEVVFTYRTQGDTAGKLGAPATCGWDIPAGKVS